MNNETNTLMDRRRFLGLAVAAGVTALAGGALAGCASGAEQGAPRAADTSSNTSSAPSTEPATETPAASTPTEPGKVLVAVFSWSGNTLQLAQHINSRVESDFFRIEPVAPYTSDYNEVLDVAQREQEEDYRPALAASIENWDSYDTVCLGYPVWWYHAPQIIKTFVSQYDLTGKTVVPFSTSGGSSVDSTLGDIRELCPNVQFIQAITLDGNAVSSSLGEVDEWLSEVGLM